MTITTTLPTWTQSGSKCQLYIVGPDDSQAVVNARRRLWTWRADITQKAFSFFGTPLRQVWIEGDHWSAFIIHFHITTLPDRLTKRELEKFKAWVELQLL